MTGMNAWAGLKCPTCGATPRVVLHTRKGRQEWIIKCGAHLSATGPTFEAALLQWQKYHVTATPTQDNKNGGRCAQA